MKVKRRQLLGIAALAPIQLKAAVEKRSARLYPRTATEAKAGVAIVDARHAPGVIDRYAANAQPGLTDMSLAVQAAADADCGSITFLDSIYLFSDVTIRYATLIRGGGHKSVLLARTDMKDATRYSRNLFANMDKIDFFMAVDLTLDGGCDNANAGHAHEVSLVRVSAASRVEFRGIRLTRYCGGWDGHVKPVSRSFWQAITVQNAAAVCFSNCLLTNNHYEQILIWNGPQSKCETLIDGCTESNDGRPNAHTAFDITGGHVKVTRCVFENTGSQSTLNVQVPKSVRIANNIFLDMLPGAAAQINIGQSTFPSNDNIVIEENYCRNANSAAIEIGPGTNVMVRGNVIDSPANYGIQVTTGVADFKDFNAIYPEWPAGKTAGSSAITIADNTINGVSDASSLSRGIFMHSVTKDSGFWFRDVKIVGNRVTASRSPNDTFFGLWLDEISHGEISDNRLQYTKSAIYFSSTVRDVRIDSNTFTSVAPNQQSDIIFFGPYSGTEVVVSRNRFTNLPVGPTPNVLLGGGYAMSRLELLENSGLHPVLPVSAPGSTTIVQHQTRLLTQQGSLQEGDWGIGDQALLGADAAASRQTVCVEAGSFGPQITCTASGTAGQFIFSCSDIQQLHVGQHFKVAGAAAGNAGLQCTCVFIEGSRFHVDRLIERSVVGASLALSHPKFAHGDGQA